MIGKRGWKGNMGEVGFCGDAGGAMRVGVDGVY